MIQENAEIGYPVMEQFHTLQGEGAYAGHAAYFLRLGGCPVGCVWCDVKESWPMEAHPKLPLSRIIDAARSYATRLAVITGGEPAIHDLGPLTRALKSHGFRTHIETSGAYPLRGELDWITLSPKKFQAPLVENLSCTQELKVVIYHRSDLDWAMGFADQVPVDCRLYLQPEWSRKEQALEWILEHIIQHPEWALSLQTHKYINIP